MWADFIVGSYEVWNQDVLAKELLALKYRIGNLLFSMISLELFKKSLALSLSSTLDIRFFCWLVNSCISRSWHGAQRIVDAQ